MWRLSFRRGFMMRSVRGRVMKMPLNGGRWRSSSISQMVRLLKFLFSERKVNHLLNLLSPIHRRFLFLPRTHSVLFPLVNISIVPMRNQIKEINKERSPTIMNSSAYILMMLLLTTIAGMRSLHLETNMERSLTLQNQFV